MSKLVLLSIMIATVALPARAARQKSPKRGLRKVVVQIAVFNALYLFGLLFIYGRL